MRNSSRVLLRSNNFSRGLKNKKNIFEKKLHYVLLLRYFSYRCSCYEAINNSTHVNFAVEGINAKPAHFPNSSNSTIVLCHWCVRSLVKNVINSMVIESAVLRPT